jgi:hypothetical protein
VYMSKKNTFVIALGTWYLAFHETFRGRGMVGTCRRRPAALHCISQNEEMLNLAI